MLPNVTKCCKMLPNVGTISPDTERSRLRTGAPAEETAGSEVEGSENQVGVEGTEGGRGGRV